MAKGTPTNLQMDIISGLAAGMTSKEICAELSCSSESVRLVKNNPELKALYQKRCFEQFGDLVPLAYRRLKDLLNDESTQGSVVIAACREVFEISKVKELADNTDTQINIKVSYE
jgi:hypothetical protein